MICDVTKMVTFDTLKYSKVGHHYVPYLSQTGALGQIEGYKHKHTVLIIK